MYIRKLVHDFWEWVYDKSPYISGLGLIVLSVIDISNVDDWTFKLGQFENFSGGKFFYYFILLVCLIFGALAIEKTKVLSFLEKDVSIKGDKIVDLETKLTEVVSEMNELFNSYLKLFVNNLNFEHTERVSVYKTINDKFVLIGRSSKNPMLCAPGRPHYPINLGLISKGWSEGEYFIDNLPDPKSKAGNAYYSCINSIAPIPREVLNKMSMRSRNYFIYRINGFDGSPLAVVVFESTRPNAFTREQVIGKLDSVKDALVMFIEKNNGVSSINNNLGI